MPGPQHSPPPHVPHPRLSVTVTFLHSSASPISNTALWCGLSTMISSATGGHRSDHRIPGSPGQQLVSEKLLFSFRSLLEAKRVGRRAGGELGHLYLTLPFPAEPRAARSNGVMFTDFSSCKLHEKKAPSALRINANQETL